MAFRRSLLVLALGIALGACGGDDDDASQIPTAATGGTSSPAGAGGMGGSAGTAAGRGGTAGASTGTAGTFGVAGTDVGPGGASGGFGGFGAFGGMGGMGGTAGSGFPPAMCPVDMPEDGSACMGRRLNCMFGMLQCLCVRSRWSCDSPLDDMDAGAP